MIKDIIHHLHLERFVSRRAHLAILIQSREKPEAFEALNYLMYMAQLADVVESYESISKINITQRVHDLEQSYIDGLESETQRIQRAEEYFESIGSSIRILHNEDLNSLLREKNNLLRHASPKMKTRMMYLIFKYEKAVRHFENLIEVLSGRISETDAAQRARAADRNTFFPTHPLLELLLERGLNRTSHQENQVELMEEEDSVTPGAIETEEEPNVALWSEALGILLTSENIEEHIAKYSTILDVLIAISPELSELLFDSKKKDLDYYLDACYLLSLVSFDQAFQFVRECLSMPNGHELACCGLELLSYSSNIESKFPLQSFIDTVKYLRNSSLESVVREFGEENTLEMILSHFVPKEQEVSMADVLNQVLEMGKLPDFNTQEYKELLPELLRWAFGRVKELSTARKVFIPQTIDDMMKNSKVDQLLNGIQEIEVYFFKVFRSGNKRSINSTEWSMREVLIMLIVRHFESKRWGRGGMKPNEKHDFMNDLMTVCKEIFPKNAEIK